MSERHTRGLAEIIVSYRTDQGGLVAKPAHVQSENQWRTP